MKELKLIEWILSNREYCDRIAGMTIEEFRAELARRNIEVTDVQKVYNVIKTSVAGGELEDSELDLVAGGKSCGMCEGSGPC